VKLQQFAQLAGRGIALRDVTAELLERAHLTASSLEEFPTWSFLSKHFPEKWTPISGLPEIGSQCRPSRLQPTPISGLPEIGSQCRPSRLHTADLGGGGFPQKIRTLKEAEAHSDSA
jgi:hypothetical protein